MRRSPRSPVQTPDSGSDPASGGGCPRWRWTAGAKGLSEAELTQLAHRAIEARDGADSEPGVGPGSNPGVKVFKRAPGVLVARVEGASGPAVVKIWWLGTPTDRLWHRLRQGRADRHQRGSERLRRAGLPTSACLGIGTVGGGDDPLGAVLVMEALPGRSLLHAMADPALPPGTAGRLAERAARLTADLFTAGLYNRDHKPSNWLVTDEAEGHLALIDTVAIRRISPAQVAKGLAAPCLVRMTASLMIEPIGVDHPPRPAWCASFVRSLADRLAESRGGPISRADRRRFWRAVAAHVRGHPNPTPADDPLATA